MTGMESTVFIRKSSYEDVAPVISGLIDLSGLSFSGKKVLVKPNMLLGKPPEAGATTHPAIVSSVVDYLVKSGAEVVVGDNPGLSGYGASAIAGKKTGIKDASMGRFSNIGTETRRVKTVSVRPREVLVSKAVLDSDIIVNLPKLKTHSLTVFTGAVKNMFGMIVGADKVRTHAVYPTPEKFAEALVEIFAIRPPELSIMDGILGMEGNGPNAGRPRHAGLIGMSVDAVALDSVFCRIIGIAPEKVPHLRIAATRGLGRMWPEGVRVDGEIPKLKPFRLPMSRMLDSLGDAGATLVQGIFMPLFTGSADLKLIRKKCTKCGVCIKSCPAEALSPDEKKYPLIDKKRCISCYCCHELCTENAWTFTGMRRIMGMFG